MPTKDEIIKNLKGAGLNVDEGQEGEDQELIQSHVNVKIASTSKGENVSIHVYEGATTDMVNDAVKEAVRGWKITKQGLKIAKDELISAGITE